MTAGDSLAGTFEDLVKQARNKPCLARSIDGVVGESSVDDDKDKKRVVTPMVSPHDTLEANVAPRIVDTDAPVSTDENGDPVDLPDLGGRVD